MKRILFLSSILLVLFSITSCEKTNDTIWVYMEEDGCPPGWVDQDSDNKTKNYLEGFLRGHDIVPLKIRVEGSRDFDCFQCDCTTGKLFRVKIYESQVGLAGTVGFYP